MQDVEEESVGVKTAATARGGTGLKRSRAAEVHNLSERVSESIPNNDAYVVSRFYLQFLALDLEMYVKSTGTEFWLFTNRGEEIGSMKRCVRYKNLYPTATR